MSFRTERSATFVQDDKALPQKIARNDALFTALMRKSILRATSHFRSVTGYWDIFHNSVNIESFNFYNLTATACRMFNKLTLTVEPLTNS
jgi:hypothetical protein